MTRAGMAVHLPLVRARTESIPSTLLTRLRRPIRSILLIRLRRPIAFRRPRRRRTTALVASRKELNTAGP
jgi:hypothetical protein